MFMLQWLNITQIKSVYKFFWDASKRLATISADDGVIMSSKMKHTCFDNAYSYKDSGGSQVNNLYYVLIAPHYYITVIYYITLFMQINPP